MGFAGKLCVHPNQIVAVQEGFAPTEAEVAWATRILEAFRAGDSATSVDGAMVDAPVLLRARRILGRRGALER
jgi:citrate lyase subunit beta/citryl-CoA lyase